MKKYRIDELIIKTEVNRLTIKKHLRIVLGIGASRLDRIINAQVDDKRDANGHQLGLIAEYFSLYFKCSPSDLFTEDFLLKLSSIKTKRLVALQAA